MDSNFLNLNRKHNVGGVLMRILLALCFLGLSACATFERDPRSGYTRSDTTDSVHEFYQDRGDREETDARDELGYTGRPLNEMEQARLEQRLRLHRMENNLESK